MGWSVSRGRSRRLRFGAVHGARSLGWSAVDLLLAWHLHTQIGLTGAQTGYVTFALLATGGAATFLVGLAFTRFRVTGPTVVRVQWPATVAASALLCAQFTARDAAAAVMIGFAFRIAYAVQDVAQNMLASLLPDDDGDARGYARLRVVLSGAARGTVGVGFALTADATALAAAAGIAMVVSACWLRDVSFPSHRRVRPGRGHGWLAMPPGLSSLLLAWSAAAALLPTTYRLLIFTPSSTDGSGAGAVLLGAFCLGSVVGPMLRVSIGRRALPALIVTSSAMILPLPFPVESGWRIIGALLHGVAVSIVTVQLWAATSHLAMAEARRGRNSEGVIFGAVILTLHAASATGMLVVGALLDGFEGGHLYTTATASALTVVGAVAIAARRPDQGLEETGCLNQSMARG